MSVEEMQAEIRRLSVADLQKLEDSIHAVYRSKRVGLLYDDAHGVLSEVDLVAAADAAFLEYDRNEADIGGPPEAGSANLSA